MKPEGSLPHLQKPFTCPCPEPDRSSPCSPHTSRQSILILSCLLSLGLPSGLLPSGFSISTLYAPLFSSYVLCDLPISFFLTSCTEQHLVRTTGNKAPHYVSLLSSPLTLSILDPNTLPQHPILANPKPTFLPQRKRPSFTPLRKRGNLDSILRNYTVCHTFCL